MEDYYKIKIFNRTPQGVYLTEAGKIVCAYAVRFLNMYNSMEQDLDMLLNGNPFLTIGASCTAGNYAMPCSICAFKAKYPEVNVRLDIGNTDTTLEKLKNHDIDIAVVEGTVENPDFVAHYINSSNLVFIAPNDIKKSSFSLKEIKQKPFILREKGAAIRTAFEQGLLKNGYGIEDLNVILEMTSIYSVKSAVMEGIGVSILPAITVEKEVNNGALKIIKIKEFEPELETDIILVHLKNEQPSTVAQQFIKSVSEQVKNEGCWNLRRMYS